MSSLWFLKAHFYDNFKIKRFPTEHIEPKESPNSKLQRIYLSPYKFQYFKRYRKNKLSKNHKILNPGQAPIGTLAKCSRFANTACFQSGTNDTFVRGCSPLAFPDATPVCDGDTCWQTCRGKYCNMSPSIVEPISCYSCRQEFDHAGNPIGGEDNGCFDIVDEELLIQCELYQNACQTDTLTEWRAEGDQRYTLIRGCHTENYQDKGRQIIHQLIHFSSNI